VSTASPLAPAAAEGLLLALYREVDREAARLAGLHGPRLRCRCGCSRCCVDEITVFVVEAEHIRRHHAELLRAAAPHPEGACAFLDPAGSCRIYGERPYVCRTLGLPLRWIGEPEAASPVEYRDICPLNEAGPALETLPEASCWTIGPAEGRLATLQASRDGGLLRRVPLRSLFATR